jgi:hypothetical protein
MTFFRYHPTTEDVALSDSYEPPVLDNNINAPGPISVVDKCC